MNKRRQVKQKMIKGFVAMVAAAIFTLSHGQYVAQAMLRDAPTSETVQKPGIATATPDDSEEEYQSEVSPTPLETFQPQPSGTEALLTSDIDETTPPDNSTMDIDGKITYMGDGELIVDNINLVFYINGELSKDTVVELSEKEDGYYYNISNLPIRDGAGNEYSYTVCDANNGGGTNALYYIYNGALIQDEGIGVPVGTNLVYVQTDIFSVGYRIEREEHAPLPDSLDIELTAADQTDMVFIPNEVKATLGSEDTQWMIEGIPSYNPINGQRIEYHAQAGNVKGYEISYENASPLQNDNDFAYANGTIVATYTGGLFAEPFSALFNAIRAGYTATGVKTSFEVEVNWNDNSDNNRPDPQLQLYYKIQSEYLTEYALLTTDILESWGVLSANIDMPTPDDTVYNSWKYLYTNLPAELTDGINIYPIEYTFEISNEADITDEYFVEKNNDSKIMLTKKTTANFHKQWKDADNKFGTRPGTEVLEANLTLFRVIEGVTEKVGLLNALNGVSLSDTTTNMWDINISGLPMYNSLGHPYQYFIVETGNTLNPAPDNDFGPGASAVYKAKCENPGNYADQTDRCYEDGTITNVLTDTVEFEAYKLWQDDGMQTRPDGNLYLYRYPDIPGMDYTTASPVSGMQLPLDKGTNSYTIDFSTGLPRFDSEGNEYIYFVQEILSGTAAGNYTRFYDYSGTTPADDRSINALFNGGTLQNRRTGTWDIPVTKTWKAAAKQDMNSDVEILVERRQKGTGDTFEPVESVGTNGICRIDGFRAEIMEQSKVLGGLPRFNEIGLEYEYRITEYAVTIDGTRTVLANIEEENGKKYCEIDGVAYEMTTTANGNGSVTIENRLVGETVIRVKKIWNGLKEGSPWGTVTLNIYRDGVAVGAGEATIQAGTDTLDGFYIEEDNSWRKDTSGSTVTDEGEWLVISGLPRYDEQGRECKYTVTENAVSGYSTTYSTQRSEIKEDGRFIGVVETTVTNTPTEEGAHIEVVKEWLDDGDENCRGRVVVDLYYLGENGTDTPTLLKSAELNSANDWWAWISLTGKKSDDTYDYDHTHYYAKERSIGGVYNVSYSSEYPSISPTFTKVGDVTTNAHFYDVYASKNTGGTRYIFRNIRTGKVNIEIKKDWVDNGYQAGVRPQEVTVSIFRWLNYTDQGTASVIDTIVLDGTETLPWQAQLNDLPKYNENGVLYHYSVVETKVVDVVSGDVHNTSGGSYTLNDGQNHKYSVIVSANRQYGEHNGGSSPAADKYTFSVKNARQDTVDFKVYKLWKDVIRTKNLDPEYAALEVKNRPHIYLVLYQKIEGEASYTKMNYVECVWTSTGSIYNDYYWVCNFDPLPRYTADGREITYAAAEVVTYPGEYYTEYYDASPAEVTGDEAKALRNVTDLTIYDVFGSPVWSSKENSWANPDQKYVQNGGTIVNGREGTRKLTGQKIWLNVPTNLSADNFPIVMLKLHIYMYDDLADEYKYLEQGSAEVTLNSGKKNFTFGDSGDTLPRYDKFGTLIRYRAQEVSLLTPGYKQPVYDDYNLTVTNEYNIAIEDLSSDELVSVDIKKEWDTSSIGEIADPDLMPVANIQLWRQLTDNSGDPIAGTEENTGKYVLIKYPDTTTTASPTFNELPRYGYNGNPFKYFLKETINGYSATGLTEDKDADEQKFRFDIKNTYTGKEYVTLSGTKEWVDQSDLYGTRTPALGIKVYRAVAGSDTVEEDITSKLDIEWDTTGDTWTYTANANDSDVGDTMAEGASLYRYAPNGALYIYYVEEVRPNHHYIASDVTGTQANGVGAEGNLTLKALAKGNDVIASFRNTLETVDLQVTKAWQKDHGGPIVAMTPLEFAMMLPAKITVKVQYSLDGNTWSDYLDKSGALVIREYSNAEFKPSSGNSRKLTISGLPKYKGSFSEVMQYRAIEIAIGNEDVQSDYAGGYHVAYDDSTNPDTINNVLETIPLVLKKTWVDNNNQDGVRPDSIEFQITRDGNEAQTFTLTVPIGELTAGVTVYVPKYQADGVAESKYTVEEKLTPTEKAYYSLNGETSPGSYTLADPGEVNGVKTYEFVNEHDEIEISITVNKKWSDSTINTTIGNGTVNANLNGIRPDPQQVTVAIQRSKDKGVTWQVMDAADLSSQQSSVVLSEPAWSYTWTGLQARYNDYDTNGSMVQYQFRVVETDINGYTATYRIGTNNFSTTPVAVTDADCKNLAVSIDVQNALDTVDLNIEKVWKNNNSAFAEKATVEVRLLYKLSTDGGWTEATGANSLITLSSANNYKYKLTGLPKENNAGIAFEYSVKEVSIGGNPVSDVTPPYYSYSDSVSTDIVGGTKQAMVTNTLLTRNSITVSKVWDDANNQDGIRPANVKVKLIKDRDNASYKKELEVELNAGKLWTHTFGDLPKYRPDGTLCTYHVQETSAIPGYSATYQVGSDLYTDETTSEAIPDESGSNVNVKNTYTPKVMQIKATKAWSDQTDKYGLRPTSIKLQLYVTTDPDGLTDRDPVGSVALVSDPWEYTWGDLPIKRNTSGNDIQAGTSQQLYYSIEELKADDTEAPLYGYQMPVYSFTAGSANGNAADNRVNGSILDATNTTHSAFATNKLDTVKVDVEKIWNNNNSFFAEKADVELRLLYRLTGEGDADWKDEWPGAAATATQILDAAGSYKGSFNNLPKVNGEGIAYEYSVKELSIGGYAVNSTAPPYSYTVSVTEKSATQAEVTNTLLTRNSITVTKVWDDANNQDGIRPANLKVKLIKDRDNASYKKELEVELNAGKLWTHTFDDLPKYRPDGTLCTYHVQETSAIPGYSATYQVGSDLYTDETTSEAIPDESGSNVNVKNTYTPKVMQIKATKAWSDQTDKYGLRPTSIKLQLFVTTDPDGLTDRKPVRSAVPVSNPWEYTWGDLPIKRNTSGNDIQAGTSQQLYYSIEELKADDTEAPLYGYQMPIYSYTAGSANGNATENRINGNILDATNTTHSAFATNKLDTADITVTKLWDDFGNLYGSRPDTLRFQLQRRLGTDAFVNVKDEHSENIIKEMICAPSGMSQSITFAGLPKYTADGQRYEYRAVEITYNIGLGDTDVTPYDSQDASEGEFGYTTTSGTFNYMFSTEVSGYTTTITNVLGKEKISLSGTKCWVDNGNQYGVRPDSLTLAVYYREGASDPTWEEFSASNYEVNWSKDNAANEWEYTIPSLPKYKEGTTELVIYAVHEIVPKYYQYNPGSATPEGYSLGVVDSATANITNVDFTNNLLAGAKLSVEKKKDRGPATMEFTFSVYISDKPMDGTNGGVLYTGGYSVFKAAHDIEVDTPDLTDSTVDGSITIKAGEKFVLEHLPLGFYYTVSEKEHTDYDLDKGLSEGMSGQLGPNAGAAVAAVFVNNAKTELAITNTTNNPGISSGNAKDAGGWVSVIDSDIDVPQNSSEDGYKQDKVAVAWHPEKYWVLGDTFTIYYTEFGETEEKQLAISDYFENGTLKDLSECNSSDAAELQRFLDCGARLELLPNGIVKLLLADDLNNMPRKTHVYVEFLPTLAIDNVTTDKQSGKVKVDTGQESNIADGVPAYGGTPYPHVQTVYANADANYMIDISKMAIRNMNDLDGQSIPVVIQPDGSFSGILATMINGNAVDVEITGHVELGKDGRGNAVYAKLVFDELTIPLQVDMAFKKKPVIDNSIGSPNENKDGDNQGDSKDDGTDEKPNDNTDSKDPKPSTVFPDTPTDKHTSPTIPPRRNNIFGIIPGEIKIGELSNGNESGSTGISTDGSDSITYDGFGEEDPPPIFGIPRTGDDSNMLPYVLLAVFSLIVLIATVKFNSRENSK